MSAESAAKDLIDRGFVDKASEDTLGYVAEIIREHNPYLLDYFAGQALQIAQKEHAWGEKSESLARFAYSVAAAMLAEKKRREESK